MDIGLDSPHQSVTLWLGIFIAFILYCTRAGDVTCLSVRISVCCSLSPVSFVVVYTYATEGLITVNDKTKTPAGAIKL